LTKELKLCVENPSTDSSAEPTGKVLEIVDIRVQRSLKVGGEKVHVVSVDYGKFFLAVRDADFNRENAYSGKNLPYDSEWGDQERYGRPFFVGFLSFPLHCVLEYVKNVAGRARGVFQRRYKKKPEVSPFSPFLLGFSCTFPQF